jgi:hypothetical protein
MKKHRINNIMKLHKNLSYAMRETNLTLRVFCVCSVCVVQSVTHHVWVLSSLVRCWRWNLDLLKWAEF